MPTENRSSNTEMVSALMQCPFCGEKPQITKHHREDIYSFMHRCPVLGPISWGFREDQQAHIEKWNARAQPAPQPHPDPIAWMVGTAFWWTKEQAERDAAETGLPIVGLGPMAGEQQQGEPVAWLDKESGAICTAALKPVIGNGFTTALYTHADPGEVERLRNEHTEAVNVGMRYQDQCKALRTQLAEAHALLRRAANYATRMEPMPAKLLNQIDDVLSASAEPSALPDPLCCNECTHAECGRFDGPRQVERRAMADNACARPGASS